MEEVPWPRGLWEGASLNTVCMQPPPPPAALCCNNLHAIAQSEMYLGWEDSCLPRNLLPKMFPFPQRDEF